MQELTLKRLKEVEVDLLKKIDEFCKENNIRYFLHAGSLLGSIRHKGFIPWDDDIDISMPREDYDRFIVLMKESRGDFSFICNEYDPNYAYAFGKISDNHTELIETNRKYNKTGVYIDVFPLDTLPNDEKKAFKFVKKCHYYTWMYFMATDVKYRKAKTKKVGFFKHFAYPISKLFGYRYWIKKLKKLSIKYKNETSEYVANVYSPNYIHVFKKEWFKESVELPFENIMAQAPCGYKELLEKMYGDYMKLPPVEKQVTHHDFVGYELDC